MFLFWNVREFCRASSVCKKWRQGMKESLARRDKLSFSGWKMDDDSTTRLVRLAYSLKELDMYILFSVNSILSENILIVKIF